MNQAPIIVNVKVVTRGMDSHVWTGMNVFMKIIAAINMLCAIIMMEDMHVSVNRVTMEMENTAQTLMNVPVLTIIAMNMPSVPTQLEVTYVSVWKAMMAMVSSNAKLMILVYLMVVVMVMQVVFAKLVEITCANAIQDIKEMDSIVQMSMSVQTPSLISATMMLYVLMEEGLTNVNAKLDLLVMDGSIVKKMMVTVMVMMEEDDGNGGDCDSGGSGSSMMM
ncbi:uncharacterized protein [Amphiura filiformis]|uniref:uncharacterized protein n=1 Tax=Amphiura filiformis TaxID=82378 RepID=UPI003B21AC9B